MAFKITIDKEKCIGCGACAAVCENFELKEGKAHVKRVVVEEEGCNREASDNCPVQCIKVEEQ